MFSLTERIELAQRVLADVPNVEVQGYTGLTVDFARKNDLEVIVRGLRVVSDFEFEFQLANMSRHLSRDIETVFLTPQEQFMFISSTLVREVAMLGGNVSEFVHPLRRRGTAEEAQGMSAARRRCEGDGRSSPVLLLAAALAHPTSRKPPHAAIASAYPLATAAGMEILDQGGNAFDAAIAVSAALAVVEPKASSLGAGGFFLLHRGDDGVECLRRCARSSPRRPRRATCFSTRTGKLSRVVRHRRHLPPGFQERSRAGGILRASTANCRWPGASRPPSGSRARDFRSIRSYAKRSKRSAVSSKKQSMAGAYFCRTATCLSSAPC